MSLLVAKRIEKAFGDRAILRGCDLSVGRGERVGLVGPNGCGKSTLLHILGGVYDSDAGLLEIDGRVGLLAQDPDLPGTTVDDSLASAVGWHRELVAKWQAALDAGEMDRVAEYQDQLDHEGWEIDHTIDAMLDRVGAPPRTASTLTLSGGERRRVALARALLGRPDVLLLDEPTNHLDADTIDWLQAWLMDFAGALVLVTHDRYLLEAIATRIVQIDDGEAVSYQGSYADYLVQAAERRARQELVYDAHLALISQEAAWAARSPAARSTKQKARLDRLDDLRAKRPLKREETFALNLKTGLKQGQSLTEITGISKGYDGRTLFSNLDLSLLKGERLGIVGANGAGKTTLMRVIAGQEPADSGIVRLSPRVRVALLDQHRTGLNLEDTVFEAAGDGNDQVQVGGEWVHVHGFLQRFMFPRRMWDQKVKLLSGGERARLLLARMLLQGCNLLMLDEPTNDLDLMTLRVLEEALLDFDGAAIVVTHDRAFLDRVCTGILSFDDDGQVVRYADRAQVARARAARKAAAGVPVAPKAVPKRERERAPARRLSFREKQEFEGLPAQIEEMEGRVEALETTLADPATWKSDRDSVAALQKELEQASTSVEEAYARWEELEARA